MLVKTEPPLSTRFTVQYGKYVKIKFVKKLFLIFTVHVCHFVLSSLQRGTRSIIGYFSRNDTVPVGDNGNWRTVWIRPPE